MNKNVKINNSRANIGLTQKGYKDPLYSTFGKL